MSRFVLRGGERLSGELTAQGAKNSVLPILAATILSRGVCVLHRCPRLRDVEVSLDEARSIGMPNYTEEISVEADSVAAIAKPVQIYLRFLGYDADRSDEYFSQASSSALAQFQRDQGLEADGVIDNETAEALVNAAGVYWNEHEEELDTQKRKAVEIIHGREAV